MMKKHFKRLLSMSLCVLMVFTLCACANGDDWVFHLNGETVDVQDVATFACIYTAEYNVTGTEQLDELYEDSITYRMYYKQQLEEDIVSTVLLYKEAKAHNMKLTKEQKKKIQTSADYVVERFSEEALEQLGVTRAGIEGVYEMKMLGDAYLESLSDEEEEQSPENERYIKVYQVTFPTVSLDENGMIQSDAEGNLKKVSSSEISKMEEDAIAFAELARQGEDMEGLLNDYAPQVSGVEKYLKYDDLEENYQTAVDAMSVGDVSGVIEADYGFYVIRLLEKDDTEYGETMSSYEEQSEKVTVKEMELDRLYSEHAQMNKEYKNVDAWDLVNIRDYIKEE